MSHGPLRAPTDQEIETFHREWSIAPHQIGAQKVALHRAFLDEWRAHARPDASPSLDELWSIRESCIAALAQPAPASYPPPRDTR